MCIYFYAKSENGDDSFEHKSKSQHPQGLVDTVSNGSAGGHRLQRGLVQHVGTVVPLVITASNPFKFHLNTVHVLQK